MQLQVMATKGKKKTLACAAAVVFAVVVAYLLLLHLLPLKRNNFRNRIASKSKKKKINNFGIARMNDTKCNAKHQKAK